jgi:multidrug resistance efflux pump
VAHAAVGRAEERLRFAQAELERSRRLVAIEATPKSELERAEAEVAVSRKELEGEQARLALLDRRGPPRGDRGHARGHHARGDAAAPAR